MARDISIAISARDNFTQAITTMRNANQHFNKDLEGLTNKLNSLNSTKITLKMDTDRARSALKGAEKQFQKTGDAADKMAVKMASEKYENARRNLNLVSKNAKQAEKDILSMTDAVGRSQNRASGSKNSMLSSLAGAGLGKMAGDAFSKAAGVGISSAFGETAGNAFSSTLSGAATGAAIGSIVPGIGTAVGAAVGTAAGAITAGTQMFQKKDEAFKSYVQGQVEGQKQQQAQDLSTGSSIASGRESSLISFTTLFGDKEEAKGYLEQMKTMANTTPFHYDDLAQMSKVLKTYGYSMEDMIPQLTKVGDTGAALGMSTQDMSMVATSLGRMNSSGKTTLEYLNPLIERGIPAMDYMAEATGKSKDQIYDMVSKGLIPGADAAEMISDYMGKANEGAMEMQSKSFAGLQSTLQGMQEEVQNAMGVGYNEERKKGMREEIHFLSGEEGKQLQEANKLVGQWKASLENKKEEVLRDALKSAMDSDEYKQAMNEDDGAKAGEIIARARIKAQNEYNADPGAQMEIESQKSLIESVREDASLKKEYYNAGKILGEEYSKGLAKTVFKQVSKTLEDYADSGIRPNMSWSPGSSDIDGTYAPNHAYGLPYVPRDNYRVTLHQGEQVLTASEARQRKSTAPTVTVSGNNFTVREEADIDKIARALAEELQKAQQVS